MKVTREKLISLRKEKSMTQRDIVEILKGQYGIEITESYYGMIEQGVRTPKLEIALSIADFFMVKPQDIFFDGEHNKNLGKLII